MISELPCLTLSELDTAARGQSTDDQARHFSRCATCTDRLAEVRRELMLASRIRTAVAVKNRRGENAMAVNVPGYEIKSEISRGSQGIVYLARQSFTSRTVAIKVPKRGGLMTSGERGRFEREMSLVAGLRHPNVVTVLGGGLSECGLPYIAMEFVDGPRLDDWLRDHPPSKNPEDFSQRLRLLIEVCGGVSHAHERGVIHGDLKPGNIVLEDSRFARVLDFGLANVRSEDCVAVHLGNADTHSQSGFAGTPAYASPRRREGIEPLDIRADIYSLGVIIHEVVVGRRSADGERSPAGVSGGAMSDALLVADRAASPNAKDRYASVAEVSQDLMRVLAGEPVSIREPTFRESTRSFVKRHPGVAVAILASAVSIFAAFGTFAAMFGREVSARHRADAAAVVAIDERNRSNDALEFVGEILADTGSAATPTEVISLAGQRAADRFADDPATRGLVLTMLSEVDRRRGRPGAALSHSQRALELVTPLGEAGRPLLLRAQVQRAWASLVRNELAVADAAIESARAISGELSREGRVFDELEVEIETIQGALFARRWARAEAIGAFDRAASRLELALESRSGSGRHGRELGSQRARALLSFGEPVAALAVLEPLTVARRAEAVEWLSLMRDLELLAEANAMLGKWNEAERALREALTLANTRRETRLGRGGAIAITRQLARSMIAQDKPDEAYQLLAGPSPVEQLIGEIIVLELAMDVGKLELISSSLSALEGEASLMKGVPAHVRGRISTLAAAMALTTCELPMARRLAGQSIELFESEPGDREERLTTALIIALIVEWEAGEVEAASKIESRLGPDERAKAIQRSLRGIW